MELLYIALALSLFALVEKAVAEEYIVGGRAGWQLNSVDFAQWTSKNIYRSGDSLLFPYEQGAQSVMRVSKEDFHLCRTNNPIEHYTDGNTIVRLGQDKYYFISGVPGHCHAGMKLEVVLAGSSPSGAPSGSSVEAPVKAPASPSPSSLSAPTPAPAHTPVPSPSTAPSKPPTVAPVSPPAVSPVPSIPTVPTPSPVSVPPPSHLSSPAPLVTSPTPSTTLPPVASSPAPFVAPTPAESPVGSAPSAASALSSAFVSLIVAALIFVFNL